jgi:hypothetical protein
MGIASLNQLSGGAALASFGSQVSFKLFGDNSRDRLTGLLFLQLLHLIITLLAGQKL